jgi:hypothetical protein
MPFAIVRGLHEPDGSFTCTVIGPERYRNDKQAQAALDKLLAEYPERGWNEQGSWARDASGQRYTFDVCGIL